MVSHDQYLAHVEPSVALNPRHPGNLLAASQVGPGLYPNTISVYVSFDRGASWRVGGALPPSAAQDSIDDVTVAFDGAGHGFVCANDKTRNAVLVWRTDDGGRTFAPPVAAISAINSGNASQPRGGGALVDHPSLTAARWERHLYVVWSGEFGSPGTLGFTRSTDGGVSFEVPRIVQQGQGAGTVTQPTASAGPRGLLCATYLGPLLADPSGEVTGPVLVTCSTDAGHSFSEPVLLGQSASQIGLPNDVRPNSGPAVAAAPWGSSVYVAFTTHQPGADHSEIRVAASHDRGRTWSQAAAVTPPDQVICYFQPQLALDDAGRVGLSAFALAGGRVDQVLLVSPPGEARFGSPLRVTSQSFDPSLTPGSKRGAWWIGDYQGLAAGPDGFHPLWNDTRLGHLELFTTTIPIRP
jgi:hypothetical protein